MFAIISARTYYQSSSWPNIIVAGNSYQKTLNETDSSRVPTSKQQASPNMTSLWRSTFFTMESLFNCSATVEMIHRKIISHLLKAKTWKTRHTLWVCFVIFASWYFEESPPKWTALYKWHTWSWHPQHLGSATKKRSNRRVLGKCGSSKNRRKNCRNHKMKSEEPWHAPAFSARWKIITGTSLQSQGKTTENTKKGKGKKSLPLPRRSRRGYHELQEPWQPKWHESQKPPSPLPKARALGELQATNAPSLQPPYGKLNRSLKKRASSKATPSLPPLSPSLPFSSPGAPQGGLQQQPFLEFRAWFHLRYNSTRNCQVEHHTIGPYNCFA